ncbi:hypothetical protein GLYMA_08G317332v4 [Glycine max]|nr:hypothetical protein GLYMA_08G317332v4 [Glycine max]KAH1054089.1 hypothetical protein GYH30_023050 [Glycine max]
MNILLTYMILNLSTSIQCGTFPHTCISTLFYVYFWTTFGVELMRKIFQKWRKSWRMCFGFV